MREMPRNGFKLKIFYIMQRIRSYKLSLNTFIVVVVFVVAVAVVVVVVVVVVVLVVVVVVVGRMNIHCF